MVKNASKDCAVGPRLSALLKERGLSNRAAAGIAGIGATSIHDWKNGVTPTDFPALARLADFLGVQFRYLLLGDEEVQRHTAEFILPETFEMDTDVFKGFCEVQIRRVKVRVEERKSAYSVRGSSDG